MTRRRDDRGKTLDLIVLSLGDLVTFIVTYLFVLLLHLLFVTEKFKGGRWTFIFDRGHECKVTASLVFSY